MWTKEEGGGRLTDQAAKLGPENCYFHKTSFRDVNPAHQNRRSTIPACTEEVLRDVPIFARPFVSVYFFMQFFSPLFWHPSWKYVDHSHSLQNQVISPESPYKCLHKLLFYIDITSN